MIFLPIILAFFIPTTQALTLPQALEKIPQNENWQRQINQVLQREATIDMATGAMLPTVNLRGSWTKQDEASRSGLVSDTQRQILLNLSQPLFQGFKALRAKEHAELIVKAQKQIQQATQRELAFNLIELYFNILTQKAEISLLQEANETALGIEAEMGRRARIGLSRQSDLLSVQAQSLRTQSQLQAAQEQLKISTINFWRFLGETPKQEEKFSTPESKPHQLQVEQIYQNHPVLLASQTMLEASNAFTKIQKSEHMPKLDFGINYYVDQEGVFNERQWDASVNLNIPIYAGGRTSAEIYQAQLQEKEAALNLLTAQRNLKETLTKLYSQYQGAKQRLQTLKQSTEVAFKNYRELKRENQLNLISNLEVMNGLNLYIQEKRIYNQLSLALLTYEYQLLALAGAI